MSRNRGFTLIELVIVVAIVAILAAIALPSFLAQIRKSRRSEVLGAMQAAALAEERVRAECTTYVNTASPWTTSPAAPAGCTVTLGSSPYTSTFYNLAISGSSGTAYTITATPQGSQANDKAFGTACSSLTYTYSAGTTTKAPTQCWSQ